MSLALLAPVDWAARVWALPFLTAVCPSERYGPYVRRGRRHKPLAERARGLMVDCGAGYRIAPSSW